MISFLKKIYRAIKYGIFTTREKEFINFHKKRQQALIGNYLAKHTVRKLQIGAQSNSIDGWLNVDIHPKSETVAYMDATEPFPFSDDSLDYIFSEHMIEHISFEDGHFMLKECFRVLKKGGKIRISTPDLAFLFGLYSKEKTDTQIRYINFSVERYLKNRVPAMDTIVINNFMRDWGHQFVHDEKSLRHLLSTVGFVNIKRMIVGESEDAQLRNVEQHGKEITEEFNHLESIVMEAVKD